MLLRGIFDEWVFEEGFVSVWILFDGRHVFRCCFAQLVFSSARNMSFDGLFQVPVESFVGIEFRGITGQVEDFYLRGVLSQPLLDWGAVMHAEVIEHKEDSASCLLDQSLKELD